MIQSCEHLSDHDSNLMDDVFLRCLPKVNNKLSSY